MWSYELRSWRTFLLGILSAMAVLWATTEARAAGRIEWGSKTLKPRSDGNSWNIDIKIYLPRPPDVPTLPMRFSFEQKVYYERAMVDGDKLIVRNVPMVGKQPVVESVDVGFLDPGTGTIQKRTRFTFKIHRDHGFDCGEYWVVVKDSRTNATIGQPTTLILGGENEVIDRRSIVFSGEKKKEKPKPEASEGGEEKSSDSESGEAKSESSEEAPPANETPDLEEPPANDEPAGEIKEKPGGCGCRLSGTGESGTDWSLVTAGLILGWVLRRQSRSPARRAA